ncbi:MAG TPA: GTP 3',8-cyclase MoaA [Steroidobacteraceae bacterium]|nr:GTP 3',8-cyclase MoaA [Steroidobacteraceae bacterium]
MTPVVSLHDPKAPLDRRGRAMHDLRISVMDRCNFRCPYCMPKETFGEGYRFLGAAERLSFSEITRLAGLFVGLGVRKLRLTGGEPLLRAGLPELVGDLAALPDVEDVALTTNGVLLARLAEELKAQGLGRVTVSLDSLDPGVFRTMSGGFGNPAEILEGVEAAIAAGLAPVKINCVVQRGVNDHTVLPLTERFRGTPVVVRFIEYMDVGTRNHWDRGRVVPSRELHAAIHARWPLVPVAAGYRGEVAERYAFADGGGEIGFISSVSQPFCGACTRARLSSEGVLYTCLFATHGLDLRSPLRAGADDATLTELIRSAWLGRADRYSESRAQARASGTEHKIEMYYIGG